MLVSVCCNFFAVYLNQAQWELAVLMTVHLLIVKYSHTSKLYCPEVNDTFACFKKMEIISVLVRSLPVISAKQIDCW